MATIHRRGSDKPTVLVIGAGVIGLGIAWRLAQRGAAVIVFDRAAAGSGASHAAAAARRCGRILPRNSKCSPAKPSICAARERWSWR